MTHRIKPTLVASFAFCVLLIAGLVAFHFSALRTLEHLYQQTLKRSMDMELATDAQHIGDDLYIVIANAVINRDMVTAARLWNVAKRDGLVTLQKVADTADVPEEQARVKQAKEAFNDIVAAYEQELLPLLQKGAGVPGPIADIDAGIDRRVRDIDVALQWLAKSESDENQQAAGQFHGVLSRTNRLGLIVAFMGLGAALAGFAVTSRLIARPLAEMTRVATEMAKGNYLVELEHRSRDQTGVLSAAFEAMIRQVRKRTAEMEQSNEHLLREVGDRKLAEEQLQQAYEELRASAHATALVRDVRIGERMSNEDLEEMALVLKMTRSATNARQCGLRLLVEARRARDVEERLTA